MTTLPLDLHLADSLVDALQATPRAIAWLREQRREAKQARESRSRKRPWKRR